MSKAGRPKSARVRRSSRGNCWLAYGLPLSSHAARSLSERLTRIRTRSSKGSSVFDPRDCRGSVTVPSYEHQVVTPSSTRHVAERCRQLRNDCRDSYPVGLRVEKRFERDGCAGRTVWLQPRSRHLLRAPSILPLQLRPERSCPLPPVAQRSNLVSLISRADDYHHFATDQRHTKRQKPERPSARPISLFFARCASDSPKTRPAHRRGCVQSGRGCRGGSSADHSEVCPERACATAVDLDRPPTERRIPPDLPGPGHASAHGALRVEALGL